jgi:hypothetical protein
MLSKTTRSVDLTTVTSTKPKTSTNNTMCDGEVQPNTTVSPATGLLLPDCDRDSDHPGQLCRLCALPRQTMVYIFSETGLRLGLRSKINTWLPTHVSIFCTYFTSTVNIRRASSCTKNILIIH